MKIAITQPTFLPWQGYFALINYVDEVVFLDLGSNDTTVELAEEVGCKTLHFSSTFDAVHLAKFLHGCHLEAAKTTLAIHVTAAWKLQDISLSINRAPSHASEWRETARRKKSMCSKSLMRPIPLLRPGLVPVPALADC